jgi:hypothetical protein
MSPSERFGVRIHPDTVVLAKEMGHVLHDNLDTVTSPTMSNMVDYAFMYWAATTLPDDDPRKSRYLQKCRAGGLTEVFDSLWGELAELKDDVVGWKEEALIYAPTEESEVLPH